MIEHGKRPGSIDKFISEITRNNLLIRRASELINRLAVYIVIRNPQERSEYVDREFNTGLLEGSILSHELFCPDEEENELSREVADAGLWVAYDFRRPAEFGPIVKERDSQFQTGKLWTYAIPRIIRNSPDAITPTDLVSPLSNDRLFLLETTNIDRLLEYGFIEQTTYESAYQSAGLYDKYREDLLKRGVTKTNIWKVTPKGNGLVLLIEEEGETKEKKDEQRRLVPELNF